MEGLSFKIVCPGCVASSKSTLGPRCASEKNCSGRYGPMSRRCVKSARADAGTPPGVHILVGRTQPTFGSHTGHNYLAISLVLSTVLSTPFLVPAVVFLKPFLKTEPVFFAAFPD